MTVREILVIGLIWAFSSDVSGQAATTTQNASTTDKQFLVITGARFTYPLVEKWIDEYTRTNPDIQIIIESRGSSDPLTYDILVDVYEHLPKVKESRDYLYIGRYAILPVANSKSSFANEYGDKGLNQDAFKQIFFHDIFSGNDQHKRITTPFTVYTRMQKAGAPSVFAAYFGFEQKDIKGTAIAGADAHLLKALLRDSTGVGYLPAPILYDDATRTPIQGLTVLPPDLNGNKKVSAEEKFYDNVDLVVERLEAVRSKAISNIPIEYLHLSVDRQRANPEAIRFLKWINENGRPYLHQYGYLLPEDDRLNDAFTRATDRNEK